MESHPLISLIINTNCLAEDAIRLSSGEQPYALRAFLLRNFIIPSAIADIRISEVIVAGVFETGRRYEYIPVEQVHRNCADALIQRQRGFEASKGDWIIFQHDDHMLELGHQIPPDPVNYLDVILPRRRTRLRHTDGEELNNGKKYGHINGHCCIMKRSAAETVPWDETPPVFTWDIEHTKRLLTAGMRIGWTDLMTVYDIELGSTPWK